MIQQAVDTFGGLDVLINNAGILRDKMSFNMDESEWDQVIDVHLKGHFATSRFAAVVLADCSRRRRARRSTARSSTPRRSRASTATPGQANYAAAKAGIASMTIVMARELERIGVRVNAICPVARTRLTETVAGDFMNPKEGEFDRFAPENISAVVCWLASDLSEGVTGQVVKVMGGQVQLVRGWRPITEATDDKPWTIESIDAVVGRAFRQDRQGRPAVHAERGRQLTAAP